MTVEAAPFLEPRSKRYQLPYQCSYTFVAIAQTLDYLPLCGVLDRHRSKADRTTTSQITVVDTYVDQRGSLTGSSPVIQGQQAAPGEFR